MSAQAIRVVKVGGSLLSFEGLVGAIRRWLRAQSVAHHVLIIGGGRLADEIRRFDEMFHLGEEASHWLCVDALRITARAIHGALPETMLCEDLMELQAYIEAAAAPTVTLFDPAPFLRQVDCCISAEPLPHNWTVTTDSIAARVAQVLGADELVLLKSTERPPADSELSSGEKPYVDQYFPLLAHKIAKVRFVNLRAW